MSFKPMTIDDIKTPAWGIDEMPALSKSLGKAKADRIRMHCLDEPTGASRRVRVIQNAHRDYLINIPPHHGGPVDDIISGVASLDYGNTKPLNAGRLHNLLQSRDSFSSEFIMAGLAMDKRQAQRYLAALKLCIKHITLHRSRVSDGDITSCVVL